MQTRDLGAAYDALLGMLNRLGPYLGYAAATITRGETTIDDWSGIEPMRQAAETLRAISAADVTRGIRESDRTW